MFIETIILILIIPLVALQSIMGVGVLVLGTPILLLLNVSQLYNCLFTSYFDSYELFKYIDNENSKKNFL